jgi:hypothetical protein
MVPKREGAYCALAGRVAAEAIEGCGPQRSGGAESACETKSRGHCVDVEDWRKERGWEEVKEGARKKISVEPFNLSTGRSSSARNTKFHPRGQPIRKSDSPNLRYAAACSTLTSSTCAKYLLSFGVRCLFGTSGVAALTRYYPPGTVYTYISATCRSEVPRGQVHN